MHATSYCIMAAVRLVGGLCMYGEYGGVAGQAAARGQRAPGSTQGGQLEEIGESRGSGGELARGSESHQILRRGSGKPQIFQTKTSLFDNPLSNKEK